MGEPIFEFSPAGDVTNIERSAEPFSRMAGDGGDGDGQMLGLAGVVVVDEFEFVDLALVDGQVNEFNDLVALFSREDGGDVLAHHRLAGGAEDEGGH